METGVTSHEQRYDARETLLLLGVVGITAGWATHLGTLPGQPFGVLGSIAQALVWMCLYAGLAFAYRRIALERGESVRSVWRKLGLCLLLALLSTYTCQHLLGPILAPGTWRSFFYLRRLLPVAFIALWCLALLPRETRALVGALNADAALAPLPQLAALLAAAAVLVSGADLAFQWSEVASVAPHLRAHLILKAAWASNTLILFSAYALVFAIVRRVSTALLLVSPCYIVLGFATLEKLRYMHSAVQPLDLLRLPEFLPLFRSFFGRGAIAVAALALGLWIGALVARRRAARCRLSPARRWSLGLLALAGLSSFPVAIMVASSHPSARDVLLALGIPESEWREGAREHGFLLSFLSELPSVVVAAPRGYSASAVGRAMARYPSSGTTTPAESRRGGVSLIVYLVESFMDPAELDLRYTADPIPNVHALLRTYIGGHAIVPEAFGGSANTEFEVLTGMTRSFMPEASLPYREYLRHPIPSLPRALGRLGYATAAIQADAKYFYDRERAYAMLGFQRAAWLDELPNVPRSERDGWPADTAVLEAIIAASQRARPFFIFAFPSSTHSPYDKGTYRASPLGVVDSQTYDASGEVKEYINAISGTDRSIGELIEYFRQRPDSTIIAILGDHLPPLTDQSYRTLFARLSRLPESERARMTRRVPLAIWANFELAPEKVELSASALPAYLLEKMGLAAPGLLAVTDSLRRRLPVLPGGLHRSGSEAGRRDTLAADTRALLADYQLLQYDLLLGKQYALPHGLGPGSSQPPSPFGSFRSIRQE